MFFVKQDLEDPSNSPTEAPSTTRNSATIGETRNPGIKIQGIFGKMVFVHHFFFPMKGVMNHLSSNCEDIQVGMKSCIYPGSQPPF